MAREIRLAWSFDPHSLRSRTLPKAALRVNQLSTTNSQLGLELFVYDLDPLIDKLPGKPIDGHVHPVMLLAFNNKIS